MSTTNIEWTDRVWNPTTGCDQISPGCAHCYAKTIAGRFWATQYPSVQIQLPNGDGDGERAREFEDVQVHDDRLTQPLRWKEPQRVFVNSMSDLFHEAIPDEFIDKVFAVMALAPQHTFQVLTKRPERMRAYVTAPGRHAAIVAAMDMPAWLPAGRRFLRVPENWPMPNVWLGTSVENQHFADERIPLLLQTPAAVRFISAEPLLGPVDISLFMSPGYVGSEGGQGSFDGLDWIIVGGESGPKARPCDVAWVRLIVQQCRRASVPVFVKQLGARPEVANTERDERWPGSSVPFDEDYDTRYQGEVEPLILHSRKGGDTAEWAIDLRVREFPTVPA